jgi:hypothetical protein
MYLSSIQQGIQSAHVTHSLFVKYPSESHNSILWDWAKHDMTMIVLNGGGTQDIKLAFEAIQHLEIMNMGVQLPFESFHEDESLGGIMTSFGIVVPQSLYDAKPVKDGSFITDIDGIRQIVDGDDKAFRYENEETETSINYLSGTAEHFFIGILKSCGLAR